MPSKILRAEESSCGLIVIDLQEKFAFRIQGWDSMISSCIKLIRFFQMLKAPMIVTEQYPKGLGHTVSEIQEVLHEIKSDIVTKTVFSACGTPELQNTLEKHSRKQWILCGIEAHVCVQQTAFDLLNLGYEIFIPVDAVNSQRTSDCQVALERMSQAGAVLSTSESLIFEILRDAKHPFFKETLTLLK